MPLTRPQIVDTALEGVGGTPAKSFFGSMRAGPINDRIDMVSGRTESQKSSERTRPEDLMGTAGWNMIESRSNWKQKDLHWPMPLSLNRCREVISPVWVCREEDHRHPPLIKGPWNGLNTKTYTFPLCMDSSSYAGPDYFVQSNLSLQRWSTENELLKPLGRRMIEAGRLTMTRQKERI
jgi:peptide/nickel transport system substrate-binding protein